MTNDNEQLPTEKEDFSEDKPELTKEEMTILSPEEEGLLAEKLAFLKKRKYEIVEESTSEQTKTEEFTKIDQEIEKITKKAGTEERSALLNEPT